MAIRVAICDIFYALLYSYWIPISMSVYATMQDSLLFHMSITSYNYYVHFNNYE